MYSATNRLRALQEFGQSIWLDELHRGLLSSGELERLRDSDGVSGVTTNPSIFHRAIRDDAGYHADLRRLRESGAHAEQIYESLILDDVRNAADMLRDVYRHSRHADGYVSFEVSPELADDAPATLADAGRLWASLARANVLLKIPATDAGLSVIPRLLLAGVNLNATLVFGVARLQQLLNVIAEGYEARVAAGQSLDSIATFASVFVSRIDTHVDQLLAQLPDTALPSRIQPLVGTAGTTVAQHAYQSCRKFIDSPRWRSLATRGAPPPRLIWASTGTKNPAFSDVKYVDALIGADTVTTVPPATLDAYRDHGQPAPRLQHDLYRVATLPAELQAQGIDLEQVARQLEREGIARFSASYRALLAEVAAAPQPYPGQATV